jgi:hypothetical protein
VDDGGNGWVAEVGKNAVCGGSPRSVGEEASGKGRGDVVVRVHEGEEGETGCGFVRGWGVGAVSESYEMLLREWGEGEGEGEAFGSSSSRGGEGGMGNCVWWW